MKRFAIISTSVFAGAFLLFASAKAETGNPTR